MLFRSTPPIPLPGGPPLPSPWATNPPGHAKRANKGTPHQNEDVLEPPTTDNPPPPRSEIPPQSTPQYPRTMTNTPQKPLPPPPETEQAEKQPTAQSHSTHRPPSAGDPGHAHCKLPPGQRRPGRTSPNREIPPDPPHIVFHLGMHGRG